MDEELRMAQVRVDAFLAETELSRADDGDCPYLPDRTSRSEGFCVLDELDGAAYRALMDRGFRRSGLVIYRPVCAGCRLCIPIRIPVATFRPSRSQRRVWRRNADLHVEVGDGVATDEKYALFSRYQLEHHDGTMACDADSFRRFCYDAPVPALELCYFAGRRLIGVSLLDVVPGALSSVYMYFDPDESRRSPGTFSILWELAYCRTRRLDHYYLGYYVPGSRTMAYKGQYQPAELLSGDGHWRPFSAEVDARTPEGW
ncbi:MAG TPA: arginyltransferase [Phycisphaerae bacterium]|nr:arginyltransferase [Phycisphaerales bacterium]HRX86366.1 arginyltransferase [Phycisphaerae bacterium]